MAGNRQGALKGAQTTKDKHGADFFKKIGSKSWDNPERSRKTGFALMEKDKHLEYSKKGGEKTKEDYKKTTNLHQETSGSPEVS